MNYEPLKKKHPPHKPKVTVEYCYCDRCKEFWKNLKNPKKVNLLLNEGRKKYMNEQDIKQAISNGFFLTAQIPHPELVNKIAGEIMKLVNGQVVGSYTKNIAYITESND